MKKYEDMSILELECQMEKYGIKVKPIDRAESAFRASNTDKEELAKEPYWFEAAIAALEKVAPQTTINMERIEELGFKIVELYGHTLEVHWNAPTNNREGIADALIEEFDKYTEKQRAKEIEGSWKRLRAGLNWSEVQSIKWIDGKGAGPGYLLIEQRNSKFEVYGQSKDHASWLAIQQLKVLNLYQEGRTFFGREIPSMKEIE